ncbi:aminodeoxychorismate synthase component I [bacterium]|nr:aminodeoxychorismate synthase component I [bacterium]
MPGKIIRGNNAERLKRFLNIPEPGVFFQFNPGRQYSPPGLLFGNPEREIACYRTEDVARFFAHVEQALKAGYFLAGYLTYEIGYAFEAIVSRPMKIKKPLGWFGVFRNPLKLSPEDIRELYQIHQQQQTVWPDYWLQPPCSDLSWPVYQKKMEAIHRAIAAGRTYQVNLTFPLQSRVAGNLGSMFMEMYRQQPVGYAGLIRNRHQTILSLSPELFFERCQDRMTVRPMKGTAARSKQPHRDAALARELFHSRKNRAENLMIVDLLRNDLGRVCREKTVKVKQLFKVEKYATLYQMTSEISGRLRPDVTWQGLFQSIYPSGSVTGAPKISTMQIIHGLEKKPRGVYTGAIGYITPKKRAVFNIPIRTLAIDPLDGKACFGVGSGIVSDSQADAEWRESHLKAGFFTRLAREYQLIETLRWEPKTGLHDLSLHIKRLKKSADFFKLPCPVNRIRASVKQYAHTIVSSKPHRIRILLNASGQVSIERFRLGIQAVFKHARIGFAAQTIDSQNSFLYHKTTNRELYNQALIAARKKGLVDVLFCNQAGRVTEGTITNCFIRKDGTWFTPPLTDGLLPGIERGKILKDKKMQVVEKSLTKAALFQADEIWLSNSVRGFFPVTLIKR